MALCVQVPRVFINGNCIGGGSDTKQLHQQGKLLPLIEQCASCCTATNTEGSGSGQFESSKWLTVLVVLFNPLFIFCLLDLTRRVLHGLNRAMLFICPSVLDTWCWVLFIIVKKLSCFFKTKTVKDSSLHGCYFEQCHRCERAIFKVSNTIGSWSCLRIHCLTLKITDVFMIKY